MTYFQLSAMNTYVLPLNFSWAEEYSAKLVYLLFFEWLKLPYWVSIYRYGCMGGWMDAWMAGCMDFKCMSVHIYTCKCVCVSVHEGRQVGLIEATPSRVL